jgi:hypothetical protein
MGDLFDRDIAEGQDLGALHETSGAVHVPDPGIAHGDLVVDVTALRAHLQVDGIAEVKPPLSLHRVGEDADDVLVFTVELELQLTLVLFEVFSTHRHHSRLRPEGAPLLCPMAHRL